MEFRSDSSQSTRRSRDQVVGVRLRWLLGVVLLLFSLLVVNSTYLVGITVLEQITGHIYQNYFYLLMFLIHLGLGLLLIVPVVVFGALHMRKARHRSNRYAIRAGLGLYFSALALLISGIVLTRFGFFEINDPLVRTSAYWVHVIAPLSVVWLFVLHRLAGPRLHWWAGVRWATLAILATAGLTLFHIWGPGEGSPEDIAKADYLPALVKTSFNGHVPPEHLMDDDHCRECHGDIARGWESSVHRLSSFNNPAYRFSVEETRKVVLARDGNLKAARLCAVCHDPVPLYSGKFDRADFDTVNDVTAHAGLTCISCHAISKINGRRGNGDFTIDDPARYPFAFSENKVLQAINQQLIKAKPVFHKTTFLKPMHKSAEYCSSCHKGHLPYELNHYRWLRGQDHYDSFLLSGVSGHRVDSFYYPKSAKQGCSDCHMPLEPSDDPAARDFDDSGTRSIHSHLFAAANTAVPALKKMPGQSARPEMLRRAARVDIFGLKEEGKIDGKLYAPLRPELPTLKPGGRYLIETVIRTTGIGHHLTQGTIDSNQLWLDVTVKSGERIIGRSGGLDSAGQVDPWSYFVNAYVLDKDGKRIDRRNAQDIYVKLYDHQIPPGAAAVVHYLIKIPEDVTAPVTLDAKLRYRKFDTTYFRYIVDAETADNDLPVTTIAEDRVTLPVGQIAQSEQTSNVPEWERWNDYGIGLLREGDLGSTKGELRQAEQAFKQVESLGFGLGALNLARVYYKEGRIDEAGEAVRRASTQKSDVPPWTVVWYSALVDRENGKLDHAIKSMEDLVATRFQDARKRGFDFSYDFHALNMLGRLLFERARLERGATRKRARMALLERARDTFERTLILDPENLTAHHNLALVNTELGATEKAEEHRALHARYKPDDQAVAQSVSLHRANNPAADHAAAAIAIYDLNRPQAYDLQSIPRLANINK